MTMFPEAEQSLQFDDNVRCMPRVAKSDEGGGPEHRRVPATTAPTGNRHLLILRFAAFNLAAFALLGAALMQGWIAMVIDADGTGLSLAIFGVFLVGCAAAAAKVFRISHELECVRNYQPCRGSWATNYLAEVADRSSGSRAITVSALRIKITGWIAVVRHISNSLVLLGLIGTVVGFIIALSGVDPESAGDVAQISPMVSELLAGMSVALYTTLVGTVLHLWLMVNYHLLAGGAARLAVALIGLGEANARPRSL